MSITEHTSHEHDSNRQLSAMFANFQDIIDRHVAELPCPIFEIDAERQQEISDKITAYLRFELEQYEALHGERLTVSGNGMFFASDAEGNVLGVEAISDGDVMMGKLDDICAYPVPTESCVSDRQDGLVRVYDETLTAVLQLEGSVFKTGLNAFGVHEAEHDLRMYTIGVPLTPKISFTN